jgi:hypothetical protein
MHARHARRLQKRRTAALSLSFPSPNNASSFPRNARAVCRFSAFDSQKLFTSQISHPVRFVSFADGY